MPRKGENIYKRKDGRWEGRYIKSRSLSGKALYGYVYAKTYRDVKDALVHAIAHNDSISNEVPQNVGIYRITLRKLSEDYLEFTKHDVKESTKNKYKNLLNSYILPELGGFQVDNITYDVLQGYCKSLLTHGGFKKTGLSPKTVSDIISLLRNIFNYAGKKGIQINFDIQSIHVKQQAHVMRILSRAEQEKLCHYLCANPTPCNLGILVSLFTGVRIGEVCALKWEDISIADQTICIQKTLQRIQCQNTSGSKTKVVITTPKSACSIRTIPIPYALAELLQANTMEKRGYLLTNTESYLEPRTLENRYKHILGECKIAPANYHALRHTFATRCIEQGFDVKSLSEILGHASVSITMNRYVHPSIALKKENMERLSSFIAVK